ncbi:agmatinase 2 [Schizosaccharomyces octosporus yFS286]|uniref:Agmatinase 2 n=1 Tax=Schizosaccharomyces octosporus (strain yFS286) TaxID=483514 RepID=S9PW97_SCHOY|nr:agmatinase 2 [Schizosaccharomyces octosporus yFS286]EPX73376.1 agmatinase 2 [Schizosaccharomyces octosporus yFS286]
MIIPTKRMLLFILLQCAVISAKRIGDLEMLPKVEQHLQQPNIAFEESPVPDSERAERWNFDTQFSNMFGFAHLPQTKCLTDWSVDYDIAIVGVPFDTAVSYRPGARFGPRAIRTASSRQTSLRSFNPSLNINPYRTNTKIIDCGDIPITPFDNKLALKQMTEGYIDLLSHSVATPADSQNKRNSALAKDGKFHPRLVSLGGDHSIALSSLRALGKLYQNVSVIHFDSHLDTWNPSTYHSHWMSEQSEFTHGTMFWLASQEGLINNGSSIHAGLRTRLSGTDYFDYEEDKRVGFMLIEASEIDEIGVKGIVERIKKTVGDNLVYLSIDIDVLDPGLAPGTGTPETGGWTSREMKSILRGLDGHLNIVGADIVEVSPPYDDQAESTALAAADFIFEIVSIMAKNPLYDMASKQRA